MTRANVGSSFLSASVAFSALNSCQNEKTALMTTTAQTAQPSCGIWPMKAMTPPAHRSSAIRCVKLARNFFHSGVPLIVWIAFGPTLFSRAWASAAVSPSGDESAAV